MRRLTMRLGVLTLLGVAAGRAQAQTPATYDACYVPSVGAMYLIKLTGLPGQCLATDHVPVSFSSGAAVADGAITTAKLADGAVTSSKLAADAVSYDNLGPHTGAGYAYGFTPRSAPWASSRPT